MVVLSLFDGISCGKVALDRVGVKYSKYISSEVDKNAIKCSEDNHKDIIRIGDATKVSYNNGILYFDGGEIETPIDLIIGGSPCQSFSLLSSFGERGIEGLKGESRLFYEYLRILGEVKDFNKNVLFLLENVRMRGEDKKKLDGYLGHEGVFINSKEVSFQNRPRYYWANFPITVPEDRGVSFQDYKEVEGEHLSKYKLNKTPSRIRMWNNGEGKNSAGSCANVTHSDKVYCLTTKQDRAPNSGLVEFEDFCRYLTTTELELAQNLPKGYTKSLSMRQSEKVLGNGWTVDVITHIFDGMIDFLGERDGIQREHLLRS